MNEMHETNRQRWNEDSSWWRELRDKDGLWRRCPEEPELGFDAGALELLQEATGGVASKDACVVGSGDNYVAFALAGAGANVTSVDISEAQLGTAAERARELDLSISFVRSDASDMRDLEDSSFDLVCSSNGFFVWISDLESVFSEVFRILKPGGCYVFYDIHPFRRPWESHKGPLAVKTILLGYGTLPRPRFSVVRIQLDDGRHP